MPNETKPLTPQQQRTQKAQRALNYLSGAVPASNESGDESAEDGDNWEWIFESKKNNEEDPVEVTVHEEDAVEDPERRGRRSSRHAPRKAEDKIIAARKGNVKFALGDSVLLTAENSNEPWVGIISEFLHDEEEDEKAAKFMWFSSEKEVRAGVKKRSDFKQNELYITPAIDVSSLDSISGRATILSTKVFEAQFPTGQIPRKSSAYGKTYMCRRGCNTRTTTYTAEFDWEERYRGTEEDKDALLQWLKEETKATKRKRVARPREEDDGFVVEDDFDEKLLQTPRKKYKTSAMTPSKTRTPSKLLTPSHKRMSVKKALEFTPLGTRMLSPGHTNASPFQAARSRLHVSSVPTSLPCREDEFGSVYSHLEAAISDGSGACIYISGTPGTGKTATVREVVAQLNASVLADELDDFIFVEINGMKVTDPHQSYSLLWEALKGDRVSPSHALDLLEREFNNPNPRRVPCVVLMDELDQLVTKNQSVMYNFFNWPGLRHSRLIVLAVANTMDLPERTLSNKISSRLGLTRITFPGYTHEQLMRIIQSRLEGVPGNIVDPDAVQFASRKVAAVSGDARRALDICRRAVELAEADSLEAGVAFPGTPSKTGKHVKSLGKVTIATVKRAINEATTSPLQQYLRSLPFSSKVLLAALLTKTRQTGLAESILGDVLDKAKQMARMDTGSNLIGFLLRDDFDVARTKVSQVKSIKAPRILSMGTSAIDLMDAGIIGLEARKADRTGKIRLTIGEDDVKLAFKEDPDIKSLGFSV
ncbi:ATPase [Phlyctema vagabunda]|uniref:Origin recognition complex subunit 1 n=1 Tax=Phlyctema vagabunda TaxID=108571 RepID=A0ABR4PBU0_9HELO